MSSSNFVSIESTLDEVRRKNFFWYGAFSSFVWMCFHFTLVFFFLLQLKSPVLVGIFLGLGNFVAFIVDSPVGVLQKYFPAKKLFIFSAILMLVVSVIFLYFIFSTGSTSLNINPDDFLKFSKDAFDRLFGSLFNIILLVISVLFYGIIKELSDVTSLSYIMNNADPSEYSELLSKNNIFSGIGSLIGLLTSGIILAFNTILAVSILVGIVCFFMVFIMKYFDNSKDVFRINIDYSLIQKLKVISPKESLESVKGYAIAQIQKTDFSKIAGELKFVFLKPMEIKNQVNWKEIYTITIQDIKDFFNIIAKPPYSYRLIIFAIILTIFGFWDTFVTSFLIDFLEKVINSNKEELQKVYLQSVMSSYVFIALLALPAYGAQVPLINLSKKLGTFIVIMAGVILSGISIFLFGFFSSFFIILIFGLINSLGYAAAMPLSQGNFSEEYNNVYAEKKKLMEIDSNASSAPLKMLLNLANVLGLVLGGLLVSVLGYVGAFVVLGLVLIGIFIIGIIKKDEWKLY